MPRPSLLCGHVASACLLSNLEAQLTIQHQIAGNRTSSLVTGTLSTSLNGGSLKPLVLTLFLTFQLVDQVQVWQTQEWPLLRALLFLLIT